MGLSDEERLENMFWSAKHLYELGQDLYKTKFYLKEPLASLCKQVWAKLLGGNSNGTYWILGGALNNPITDSTNAWAIAISSKFEDVHTNRQGARIGIIRDRKEEFDPFDCFLSERGLIGQDKYEGPFYKVVYDIYAYTESMIYALRRYDDELRESFSDLSDLISEIQGLCFSLFTTSGVYARAYLVHQILKEKFYANKTINRIALKDSWHHHYSLLMDWSLDEIMRLHKELFVKEPTLQSLLKYSLIAMGRRYHYQHLFNALVKELEALKDPSINIEELRGIWKTKCFDAHELKEKEDMNQYVANKDEQILYTIHGYEKKGGFFEDRKDTEEDIKPVGRDKNKRDSYPPKSKVKKPAKK